jgi:acyl-[acyl-carrier-protein] desaturase
MADLLSPDNPELKKRLWPMFRDFFSKAERKRRWTVDEDIPWHTANDNLPPAIATIIESFCAVELYLPDYVAKALPLIRTNRAWAWTHINWGYEESKHSIALEQWLVQSGSRTEDHMNDLSDRLFQHEWNLPQDSAAGMMIYALTQELATWLSYRNLRKHVREEDDPALYKLLGYVAVDERAHHCYYLEIAKVLLEIDRQETINLLRRVIGNFSMPAVDYLADTRQLRADIRALEIFDEDIFYRDVVVSLLESLGITRAEFRERKAPRKSQPVAIAH